jgi:hypothetical protein
MAGEQDMSIENLAQYFSTIKDPRCSGKVEHRLIDVLVIAVCAVIAGAESWDDIARYGRSKLAWFCQGSRQNRRDKQYADDCGGPVVIMYRA